VWKDAAFGSHRLTRWVRCFWPLRNLRLCGRDHHCPADEPHRADDPNPGTLADSTNAELTSVRVFFSEAVLGSMLATCWSTACPQPRRGQWLELPFQLHATGLRRGACVLGHRPRHHRRGWPKRLVFYENNPDVRGTTCCGWNVSHARFEKPTPFVTLTNLTEIRVTFSEPVTGVDAGDLLVDRVPAFSVSGSGSNYTFSFRNRLGTVFISWLTTTGSRTGAHPKRF